MEAGRNYSETIKTLKDLNKRLDFLINTIKEVDIDLENVVSLGSDIKVLDNNFRKFQQRQ